ncbi:adhesin [Bacillus sp. AKBS9]|nr:adhesin [Bacillus sp. AKBS9]
MLEKPEVTEKPEIWVNLEEEENKEGTTEETTEEIEDLIKPEEPNVTEEPNVLEKPEVTEKPETWENLEEEKNKEETAEDLNVLEKREVKEQQEVSNKSDAQGELEVPSSKESDKQSKLLPQTGGTATESTSILAGMLALILGARVFRRSKK